MKLFITRHGQTDMNVREEISGNTEANLTDLGKKQAEALAEKLYLDKDKNNIEFIYVSSLNRARKTAEPIEKALGIKAIVDDRLQEMHFGTFEKQHWMNNTEFRYYRNNIFTRFPEGESFVDVVYRGYSIVEEIKERHKGHNVLFVCHNTISKAIATYFDSYTLQEISDWKMDNCQLLCYDL